VLTRRRFSECFAGFGLLASTCNWSCLASSLTSAEQTNQACDLLIKGGTVIDPGRNIHAPLDVAVKNGRILELLPDIPANLARELIYAHDKFVTPGLIDLAVHVYDLVGPQGINADHYCLPKGVTTAVDAGSAGYPTIGGFRKYVVEASATRLYAWLDIGSLGLVVGAANAMQNLDWVSPRRTAQEAESNKATVVGISTRISKDSAGTNDLEILSRTRQAAEMSSLPMMVSIGDTYSPLRVILDVMRKGDVLTHCYTGQAHGLVDTSGKILPEVREARDRGILFDVGHGRARFSFKVAQACLEQNFLPDTISTDLSTWVVNDIVFDLPTTLSKFLALGLSLDKVIELATIKPAQVFSFGLELGTLRPGNPADVAIWELRKGDFIFTDSSKDTRIGRQKLVSTATIRAGRTYINQSQS
jgi:dihydroorotase